MSVRILQGDALSVLKTLPDESVHCCISSPPYWGLRDYGTAQWEGGEEGCKHEGSARYYTEKTAASSSSEAFSEPGLANAERLKKGRWREGGACMKCGALHIDSQLGLEPTPEAHVEVMVAVFREVRRVLRKDGTLWLNYGDSYNNRSVARQSSHQTGLGFQSDDLAKSWKQLSQEGRTRMSINEEGGLKEKDLIGMPWRVAFALQADGWYLRQDIIWAKPNPMPESVRDRCTKAHEYIFLLSKSPRYFFDAEAIVEEATGSVSRPSFRGGCYVNNDGGSQSTDSGNMPSAAASRNKRSVWTVATAPFLEAHFATFPPALIEPMILAGCPRGGTVLDPFFGAGTTGLVSDRLGRDCIGIELNETYAAMAKKRIQGDAGLFADIAAE